MMKKPFALATVAACLAFLLLVVSPAGAAIMGTATELEQQSREEPRSLIGEVRSSQGQPLADAVVYLKNTKTLMVKTFITEGNGSYRFPALSPNVDYEVHAEYKGARSDTKTLSSFDTRKQAIIHLKIK